MHRVQARRHSHILHFRYCDKFVVFSLLFFVIVSLELVQHCCLGNSTMIHGIEFLLKMTFTCMRALICLAWWDLSSQSLRKPFQISVIVLIKKKKYSHFRMEYHMFTMYGYIKFENHFITPSVRLCSDTCLYRVTMVFVRNKKNILCKYTGTRKPKKPTITYF